MLPVGSARRTVPRTRRAPVWERHTLWLDLGTKDFLTVLRRQHELSALRREGLISDVVLVTEHPSCLTVGRGGHERHLLVEEHLLAAAGIPVHRIDRGGSVTYHGPGQLVFYPIVDLRGYERDVHAHVRRLEEVMIRVAAAVGVDAWRDHDYPGAWTASGKVGAVGIGVRRWVTTHGAALNVHPRMEDFELIVPCGIRDRAVASLEQETGKPIGMAAVRRNLKQVYGEVFGTTVCGPEPIGVDRAHVDRAHVDRARQGGSRI